MFLRIGYQLLIYSSHSRQIVSLIDTPGTTKRGSMEQPVIAAGKGISVVTDGLIDAFIPIFPVTFSTYVDS